MAETPKAARARCQAAVRAHLALPVDERNRIENQRARQLFELEQGPPPDDRVMDELLGAGHPSPGTLAERAEEAARAAPGKAQEAARDKSIAAHRSPHVEKPFTYDYMNPGAPTERDPSAAPHDGRHGFKYDYMGEKQQE